MRHADRSEALAIARLVNRAYEVEQPIVDGDRTSPDEIARMIDAGTFLVLENSGELAAVVYVEARPGAGYLGMLAVDPDLQGLGLGKRLVRVAEALSEAMGAKAMRLRVLSVRANLLRWYRSLGYVEVGMTPYEHRPVKQPCHLVDMFRNIDGVAGHDLAPVGVAAG